MLQIFKEIGAIAPLKKVVMGKVKLASKLAARALSIMEESVPIILSPRVPLWTTEDVSCWIHQVDKSHVNISIYLLNIYGSKNSVSLLSAMSCSSC